jgi:hypothetical protein
MQTKQGGKNKQISKHELRQQARAKRKAEWEAFLSTKPDDNYVNPVDTQAIIDATRNMGDYKLKSEKSYVPDENQRMTPKRKKQQVRGPTFNFSEELLSTWQYVLKWHDGPVTTLTT